MEVCEERRADPPLPQAHRCQAVQVPQLRSLLLEVRSPGAAHEAPHVRRDLSRAIRKSRKIQRQGGGGGIQRKLCAIKER